MKKKKTGVMLKANVRGGLIWTRNQTSQYDTSKASAPCDNVLPGQEGRYKATWTRKLAWREAGPPNHLDDKVDSDQ